jgi:hypothetical protein
MLCGTRAIRVRYDRGDQNARSRLCWRNENHSNCALGVRAKRIIIHIFLNICPGDETKRKSIRGITLSVSLRCEKIMTGTTSFS